MSAPAKPAKPKRSKRRVACSHCGDEFDQRGKQEHCPLCREAAKRTRCKAKTGKGTRCKLTAAPGADRCKLHLGVPGVGRPTKLDDLATARIVEILRAGGYVETAAAAAGVSRRAFYEWMERGVADGVDPVNEPYRAFRRSVEQALAEGETINVALVATAARKDWRAAAWLLERSHPGRWAGPRGRALALPEGADPAEGADELQPGVLDDQVGPDGIPL